MYYFNSCVLLFRHCKHQFMCLSYIFPILGFTPTFLSCFCVFFRSFFLPFPTFKTDPKTTCGLKCVSSGPPLTYIRHTTLASHMPWYLVKKMSYILMVHNPYLSSYFSFICTLTQLNLSRLFLASDFLYMLGKYIFQDGTTRSC